LKTIGQILLQYKVIYLSCFYTSLCAGESIYLRQGVAACRFVLAWDKVCFLTVLRILRRHVAIVTARQHNVQYYAL